MLHIRELTQVIKSQQRMGDKIYRDAIEMNYSHEQMTPLNSIMNNSAMLLDNFQSNIECEDLN